MKRTGFEAVEAERRRYEELFDFTPDGYLVTDPFGIIKEANRAASALFSVPKDFLPGKSLTVFVAEEDHQAFRSQIVRMSELERLQDWEARLQPREHSAFPAAITVTAIRDENKKLTGLRWLIRDITKRKELEKEVSYLASFPKLNPNPITEVDFTGAIHFINFSAKKLFPDLEKTGGRHPWLGDLKGLAEMFDREGKAFITREVKIGDFWYEQVWFRAPERDRLRVYGHDITERKRAEEALRDSEGRLRVAQQVAQVGTFE